MTRYLTVVDRSLHLIILLTVHDREDQAKRVLRLIRVGEVHHEPRVDPLQDLLLYQHHRFAFALLNPLLLQLLACVHFTRRPDLRQKKTLYILALLNYK
jgi:hypothetical protein